jgi:hypothetical protein
MTEGRGKPIAPGAAEGATYTTHDARPNAPVEVGNSENLPALSRMPDGSQKLKLALDETRMLVLGAQVLLGFQLRGAFQEGFEDLPAATKGLHVAALMLMTLAVGLLIAPAIHHRVAGRGIVTAQMHRLIGRFMMAALVPLGISLAINVSVVMERLSGPVAAVASGMVALGLGMWFWFGAELLALRRKGGKAMRMPDEHVSLAKKIDQMLTEARVILPGAQALLGFQLTVVLTEAFERLPPLSKGVHALALAAIAVCTILLMAPAAYHRMVYSGEASREFYDLGSRFIMAATLALALGLSADIYVVIAKIVHSGAMGFVAAVAVLATLLGLWHVSPLVHHAWRSEHGVKLGIEKP